MHRHTHAIVQELLRDPWSQEMGTIRSFPLRAQCSCHTLILCLWTTPIHLTGLLSVGWAFGVTRPNQQLSQPEMKQVARETLQIIATENWALRHLRCILLGLLCETVNALATKGVFWTMEDSVQGKHETQYGERVSVLRLIREMLNSLSQVTGTNSGHLL